MEDTDQALLRRFAQDRSEEAFAELVRRHLDLVHSAALRLAAQCPELAEDIAQQVFFELARQARQLQTRPMLEPWLYKTTRFVASNARRAEARRRKREMEFCAMNQPSTPDDDSIWEETAKVLDHAMADLGEADRTVVLLRFFRHSDFKSIGQSLDLSHDGARMRVNRALEKLRQALARRGIQTSTATLAAILGTHAISAAPPALAATITSGALALGSMGGAASSGLLASIIMTKAKIGLIATLLIGGISTPLIMQQRQIARLEMEAAGFHDNAREFASLRAENQRLSNVVAQARNERSAPPDQLSELMKLRALVTGLRRDSAELAKLKSAEAKDASYIQSALDWKARVETLKQGLQQMPEHRIPQLQLLREDDWFDTVKNANLETEVGYQRALGALRSRARANVAERMSVALKQYVKANDGQLPRDTMDLAPFFPAPVDPGILQQYQMLHTGILSDALDGAWLISEREPVQHGFDSTFRVGYDRMGVHENGRMEKALGEYFAANP